MALLLNIDTAVEAASICLAKDGKVLSFSKNEKQKDHASWLHVAIKEMFEKNNAELNSIDAVGLTEGPGSYTGLRIGMATAKGICYALSKPLITLNTLAVMANAAKDQNGDLLCPMIDARRMEVFTALYKKDLQMVKEPVAMVIDEKSFDEELMYSSICFFGNGSNKFRNIKHHANAFFSDAGFDATAMVSLAERKYMDQVFADLAYAEPLYLKEFHSPAK
jgi:tRNA threonylcarbamoyladenosine biosynthesis protein TsaB